MPGEGFRLYVWAWVPPSSGLAYLTLACMVEILETESMARDCAFDLHPLTVQGNLGVNDCAVSAIAEATWGAVKSLYR